MDFIGNYNLFQNMGPCISKNSKSKKKPSEIDRQESFYEIFQVNENFNKFIGIPNPHESNLNILNQNKSSELSNNAGNFQSSSIILEESFSSIIDPKITDTNSLNKYIPDSFSHATETTKNDSIGQKKGLHSILFQSISKVEGMNKNDLEFKEKQPISPNDLAFFNFAASQSFFAQLFPKQKNFEIDAKSRKWGPKRLTAYNMNFAANQSSGNLLTPNYQGIPGDSKYAEDDLSLYMLTPSLEFSISLTKNRESKFINSFACTDIEKLNLQTDGTKIHVFYVPFLKKLADKSDNNLKTVEVSDFEFFYKTIEIGENQNLNRHFNSFPSKWKKGEIPYFIEKSLMFVINSKNESLYNVIIDAFEKIHNNTVIRFVCYASEKHPDYLHFDLGKFNRALMGRHNGKNSVTLNSKADLTVVLHEIMHCLGFMHEHRREKGDSFAYICKNQLKSSNFIEDNTHVCLAGINFGPFDSSSVMHFHCCEHMISYRLIKDTQESGLSQVDCAKINFYYEEYSLSENDIMVKWNKMKKMAEKNNKNFQLRLERH